MSEKSTTPAGAAPVAQIEREAAALSALLVARRPEAAWDARAVALDATMPERMRAFWEAVGYSKRVLGGAMLAPDDARETEAVRTLVADWQEQGEPGGEITLPARFRAIERYDAQDFWITDESSDAADPAVVVGSESLETLDTFCPSYLFLATKAVLGAAFHGTVIAGLGLRVAPTGGRTPFPALAPRVLELPQDLWLLALDHEAPAPERPTEYISAPSVEKLVSFVTSLPAGSVTSLSAPRGAVFFSRLPPAHELFGQLLDLAPAGGKHVMRAGTIEGVPALLTGAIGGPLQVSVDAAHRPRIVDALRDAGARVNA